MGIVVKLVNVRMTFPHLGVPDRWGKYSVGVLVQKGTPAHDMLMQKLREAWAAGADAYGRSIFEPNPTNARLLRASYIKDGDGEDAKGRPSPDWMRGCLQFGCQKSDPAVIVDGNLEPISGNDDGIVYPGQICHVSLDLVAFNDPGSHNSGISRYLRSVVVLGGGERIITHGGKFTDIIEEWGDLCMPNQ